MSDRQLLVFNVSQQPSFCCKEKFARALLWSNLWHKHRSRAQRNRHPLLMLWTAPPPASRCAKLRLQFKHRDVRLYEPIDVKAV